jgi:hypothetical protein
VDANDCSGAIHGFSGLFNRGQPRFDGNGGFTGQVELGELKIQTSGSVTEAEAQSIQLLDYARHGSASGNQNRVVVVNWCDYGGLDQVTCA